MAQVLQFAPVIPKFNAVFIQIRTEQRGRAHARERPHYASDRTSARRDLPRVQITDGDQGKPTGSVFETYDGNFSLRTMRDGNGTRLQARRSLKRAVNTGFYFCGGFDSATDQFANGI